jgi:catechol 2,3-dioxygenase-like lactoylglutathione lyase family enzyme
MSHVRRLDHVGITVDDLDLVTGFFVGLGLEVEGRLRPPGGGTGIELSSFVRPDHEPGSPVAMANELGLRGVVFEVDDLQAAVDGLAANGSGLVGGIASTRTSGMAYVRGAQWGSSSRWPSGPADARAIAPRQVMWPHLSS